MEPTYANSLYRWPASTCIVTQNYDELRSAHDNISIAYPLAESLSSHLNALEWLRRNPNTSTFSALLERSSSLGQGLFVTSPTHTIFAPTDEAFESLLMLSDERMGDLLRHHISPHGMPSGRILETPNVPTLLRPQCLNGPLPVRIRPSSETATLLINSHAEIVNADIGVKDGLIHLIDNVLEPPPRVASLLSILPRERFSVLLNILKRTNFCKELDRVFEEGGTFFAPTNEAFHALRSYDATTDGLLFGNQSECFLPLLRLHASPGETLFSNMFFHGKNEAGVTSRPLELPISLQEADVADAAGQDSKEIRGKAEFRAASPRVNPPIDQPSRKVIQGQRHFPLPTLLPNVWIGADITRYGGIISMNVSGGGGVIHQDVILANCVVHAVDRIVQPLSESLREVLEACATRRNE